MVDSLEHKFHNYAMNWFADSIEFFVDDQSYFTFHKIAEDSVEVWPFDQPHYVILNLAIGGGWGGLYGVDTAIFPLEYMIDYVRYYEFNDKYKVE